VKRVGYSIFVAGPAGDVVPQSLHSGPKRFDVARLAQEHYHTLQIAEKSFRTKTVESYDITGAMLCETVDYDLVVIGITNEPRMYRAVKSTIPETIARLCTAACPG
jgi:hypothetical protein